MRNTQGQWSPLTGGVLEDKHLAKANKRKVHKIVSTEEQKTGNSEL